MCLKKQTKFCKFKSSLISYVLLNTDILLNCLDIDYNLILSSSFKFNSPCHSQHQNMQQAAAGL